MLNKTTPICLTKTLCYQGGLVKYPYLNVILELIDLLVKYFACNQGGLGLTKGVRLS